MKISLIICLLTAFLIPRDALCQTSTATVPSPLLRLTPGDSNLTRSYDRARFAIDSLVAPYVSRMLQERRIDAATVDASDKMITLSKQVQLVNIYNITYTDVRFTTPWDDTLRSISRSLVSQILYDNGRIDVFTPLEDREISQENLVDTARIIIRGQKDWMKVRSTEDEAEVRGLLPKGSISAKYESSKGNAGNEELERRAINLLKKKAARLRAHYVLIESKFFHKAYGDMPSVEITATAFGYE